MLYSKCFVTIMVVPCCTSETVLIDKIMKSCTFCSKGYMISCGYFIAPFCLTFLNCIQYMVTYFDE